MEEGKRKEAVEEAMKAIGVEIEAKEVWRIADEREKEREMVGIRIEKGRKRKEIWKKKKKLIGRKERIVENWTWKERKMR